MLDGFEHQVRVPGIKSTIRTSCNKFRITEITRIVPCQRRFRVGIVRPSLCWSVKQAIKHVINCAKCAGTSAPGANVKEKRSLVQAKTNSSICQNLPAVDNQRHVASRILIGPISQTADEVPELNDRFGTFRYSVVWPGSVL